MNVTDKLRGLRRRPPADNVPRSIRKVWLAREYLADAATETSTGADQDVVYSDDEALILRGDATLRTRPHPAFRRKSEDGQPVSLYLWIEFRVPFAERPAVTLTRPDASGYLVKPTNVSTDGFQIDLHVWEAPAVPEITVSWRAAGFPEQPRG